MSKSSFTAPRGKDVRNHCQTFKMVSLNEEDQKFLAHLYRTIWITGGKIDIEDSTGIDRETYYFDSPAD